jgi:acetyltransferase-like isoleucine patch superfamily enzyme
MSYMIRFESSLIDYFNYIESFYWRIKACIWYKTSFKYFGSKSIIIKPIFIRNPKFIAIGKNVIIRNGVRLEVIPNCSGRIPMLTIGDNVNIEQNVHIVCHSKIEISSGVSITANCSIVDVTHPYSDINNHAKIGSKILEENSFIEIGEGSFVGIGSTILPNVSIGKYVIIGANSVVTKSIPDYSIVIGSPARIISQFNQEKKIWEKIDML